MPGLLETDAITTQNITSSLLVGSYTAPSAGWVGVRLRLSGLATGGRQTITAELVVNDGSDDHPAERASGIKSADADTRFQRMLTPVWLTAGDVLKVYAESSSASDTSISGSVSFIDAGNPVDVVRASTSLGAAIAPADVLSDIANGATVVRANDASGDALATASVAAAIQAKTVNLPASPAAVSDIPTVAQIEAALLDDGDGAALKAALLATINAGLDLPSLELAAIAYAVRTELATELGRIDENVSAAKGLTSTAINSVRDALLNRILAGNHDTDGTPGKILQDVVGATGGDLSVVLAVLAGKRTLTDNGNGTKTARCFAADGVTAKVDLTFDATGAISAVEVDPA